MTELGALLLFIGSFAVLVSAIGLWRLPDVYCRCHAAGIASTIGVAGLMFGSACFLGEFHAWLVAALVTAFVWIKNPVGSHALARAAMRANITMWKRAPESGAKASSSHRLK